MGPAFSALNEPRIRQMVVRGTGFSNFLVFLGHIFYSLDETMDMDDIYREGVMLNQELLDKGWAQIY